MEVDTALLIEEPLELRDQMRALAALAPSQVRSRLREAVAELAAAAFRAVFEIDEVEIDLEAACRSYQRELWLWLVGERTWAQCLSGLEGRFSRRLRSVGR